MNSWDLVSRVRKQNGKARGEEIQTWDSNAGFVMRKLLYFGPYRLRFLNSSFWNWLALVCLGTFFACIFHKLLFLFGIRDLTSIFMMQASAAVLVTLSERRSKCYLDQLDVPLLDHFSTLPWSDRRLLSHFMAGMLSRSGFSFAYWIVCGICLHYWAVTADPPSLTIAVAISLAIYASLIVWKLFLLTIDQGLPRKVLLVSTIPAPFVWPFALLWMINQGTNPGVVVGATIAGCSIVIGAIFVATKRLYRRLAIVEFIGHTPASFAIPFSEKRGFLEHQKRYESTTREHALDSINIPPFDAELRPEGASDLSQKSQHLDYSKLFWERQGLLRSIGDRFLRDREKQVVALAEMLTEEPDFPHRFFCLHAFQLSCLLAVLCLAWLSSSFTFVPLLLLSGIYIQSFVAIRYISRLIVVVPINIVRILPYSSREIVWALVKRCWIESFLLSPILACTLFEMYLTNFLGIWIYWPRILLVLITLFFSLPMVIVSFRFHEHTMQSCIDWKTVLFVVYFLLGILGSTVAMLMMISGWAIIACLGALSGMLIAFGITETLIRAYRSMQIDIK